MRIEPFRDGAFSSSSACGRSAANLRRPSVADPPARLHVPRMEMTWLEVGIYPSFGCRQRLVQGVSQPGMLRPVSTWIARQDSDR